MTVSATGPIRSEASSASASEVAEDPLETMDCKKKRVVGVPKVMRKLLARAAARRLRRKKGINNNNKMKNNRKCGENNGTHKEGDADADDADDDDEWGGLTHQGVSSSFTEESVSSRILDHTYVHMTELSGPYHGSNLLFGVPEDSIIIVKQKRDDDGRIIGDIEEETQPETTASSEKFDIYADADADDDTYDGREEHLTKMNHEKPISTDEEIGTSVDTNLETTESIECVFQEHKRRGDEYAIPSLLETLDSLSFTTAESTLTSQSFSPDAKGEMDDTKLEVAGVEVDMDAERERMQQTQGKIDQQIQNSGCDKVDGSSSSIGTTECTCNAHDLPPLDTKYWPQAPLLFRPKPNSGTHVIGIRKDSSDEYLWTPGSSVPWWTVLRQQEQQEKEETEEPNEVHPFCKQCVILPINNGNEPEGESIVADFETPLFEGSLLLRLRDSEGTSSSAKKPSSSTPSSSLPVDDDGKHADSDNSEDDDKDDSDEKEKMKEGKGFFDDRTLAYQAVVRGRFKKVMSFTDLVTGTKLDRSCGKLPPRLAVWTALKFVSLFAPQLKSRLDGDQPYSWSPLGSTPRVIEVDDGDDGDDDAGDENNANESGESDTVNNTTTTPPSSSSSHYLSKQKSEQQSKRRRRRGRLLGASMVEPTTAGRSITGQVYDEEDPLERARARKRHFDRLYGEANNTSAAGAASSTTGSAWMEEPTTRPSPTTPSSSAWSMLMSPKAALSSSSPATTAKTTGSETSSTQNAKTCGAAAAAVAAATEEKTTRILTDPNKVYTMEFLQHLFDYQNFSIDFGSIQFNMKDVLNGQPMQLMAAHVTTNSSSSNINDDDQPQYEPLWSFEIWNECLLEDSKTHIESMEEQKKKKKTTTTKKKKKKAMKKRRFR